jgi:geranylgeranyl diphosphate synthase type I
MPDTPEPATMSLAELTPRLLEAIEAELRRTVGSEAEPRAGGLPAEAGEHLADYYGMLAYHMGWADGRRGGKRLRPLLCLLCCSAAGAPWQRALPVAAAIELIHNFSLIHDDIQDRSEVRHGRPTLWVRWGIPQAINTGDGMFALAHLAPHRLLECDSSASTALGVLETLDQTCLALTQGQHLDMAFEKREMVSVAEYLAMIEKKTAALIAAAALLGARLGGATPERQQHFHAFGRSLGIAFQLQDDLLGIWGDPALTGKSAASDLEARKKSLPVVYGLERSPEFARAYAQPHTPGASVQGLASTLEQLGARAFVEATISETTAAARAALALAQPAGAAGPALDELTDQLLTRRA